MSDKVYVRNIHTYEGIFCNNIRQRYQKIMKFGMSIYTLGADITYLVDLDLQINMLDH